MKIVLQHDTFGEVEWKIPQDLAHIIDAPENTLVNLLEEAALGRQLSEQIAGMAKGEIIWTIQKQMVSFFTLLVTAHRQTETANPPSKYSRIIERGLVWTATEMKKAATQ